MPTEETSTAEAVTEVTQQVRLISNRVVKAYVITADTKWTVNADLYDPLMRLNGLMYVSVSTEADLSENEEITMQDVDLTDAALLHKLRSESDVCQILNSATQEKIREMYSADDEIQAIRENDTAYHAYVAEAVKVGRDAKDALGLVTP